VASRGPRSKGTWLRGTVRAAMILAMAALAGGVALSSSVAQIYSRTAPKRALAWAPNDARAMGEAAALLATQSKDPQELAMARQLAAAATGRDPTVISAFRALGLVADLEGEGDAALRYFTRASELSRRDRPTQLWFIAYHERRRDEVAFVRQFDIALRTSESNLDELLPVLVSATAEPRLLPPLREALAKRPPWELTFMVQLISFGPDLPTVVSLAKNRLDPDDEYQRSLIDRLIDRLVTAGEYGLAAQVFADAAPAGRAAGVWGGDFESETEFAPFGWDLTDEEDLFALRGVRPDDEDSYALLLTAFNSKTGTVARQLLQLDPGVQRLQGEAGDIPAETYARPRVKVSCAGRAPGGEPLLEAIPPAGSAPKRFNAQFRVPAGCRWQWLTIDLAGQGAEPARVPWIDNLVVNSVSGT
jgi:hypothetical protein